MTLFRRLALAGCGLVLVQGAWAAEWFSDDNFEEIPWEEIADKLPPVPPKEGLVEIPAAVLTPFRYAVDPASVSVGPDGVVRYSLVATSESGARNIVYEGMRCVSRERRIYATAFDGKWTRARNTAWQPIAVNRNTAAQAELYTAAFCDLKAVAGPAPVLVERMRTIRQRSAQHRND